MPKVIENLRTRILEDAKRRLKEQGYGGLRIRQIAADCDIALGTMYNYFRSKDMLVGAIIAEDWLGVLCAMDREIAGCASVHEGLCVIAGGLEKFSDRYREVWREYGSTSGGGYSYAERHVVLVDAISSRIASVVSRFSSNVEEKVCYILSEAMISLASHGKEYEDHSSELERMIRI